MRSQEEKGLAFRALHEGDPFVIPNPWDAGSARVLEALGFEALATTSSGFAFTLGQLRRPPVARHARTGLLTGLERHFPIDHLVAFALGRRRTQLRQRFAAIKFPDRQWLLKKAKPTDDFSGASTQISACI